MQRTKELRAEIETSPDPREGEAWFDELDPTRRAALTDTWRAGLRQDLALHQAGLEALVADAVILALVFGIADWVLPLSTTWRLASEILAGLGLGAAAARLGLERFSTAVAAVVLFFGIQWAFLGGLTAFHLFGIFPFTAACALCGWTREERGSG